MADTPQPPIAPLDPTPLAPADLRIEALEAMIRGLGARIEQMTLPPLAFDLSLVRDG